VRHGPLPGNDTILRASGARVESQGPMRAPCFAPRRACNVRRVQRPRAFALIGSAIAASLVASTPAWAVTAWQIRSSVGGPGGAPLLVGLGDLSRTSGVQLRLVTGGQTSQWTVERANWSDASRPGLIFYRFVNRYSGFCMETAYPYGDRSAVVQRPCRTGVYSPQGWWSRRATLSNRIQLVNQRANMCLDITDFHYTPTTPLQVYSCSEGLNQKFYLDRLELP